MKENEIFTRITQIKNEINLLSVFHPAQLIAVSKTKPISDIYAAIKAGHREFGENKVQEAMEKWQNIKQEYPDVTLHLIGGLQKNKVRKAIQLFDVIQTLDREDLADAIARIAPEEGRNPELYIQVNVGDEPQKSGVSRKNLDSFYGYCHYDLSLNIQGLMAIPPEREDATPYFKWLHQQQEKLGLPYLSMGMSADYKQAIAEGATHIRLGQAIFGGRT
ncbi:MAG: YggS family pyridoxal phosphate-dependent enzyme [Alphaproteobacteria bacterium]